MAYRSNCPDVMQLEDWLQSASFKQWPHATVVYEAWSFDLVEEANVSHNDDEAIEDAQWRLFEEMLDFVTERMDDDTKWRAITLPTSDSTELAYYFSANCEAMVTVSVDLGGRADSEGPPRNVTVTIQEVSAAEIAAL